MDLFNFRLASRVRLIRFIDLFDRLARREMKKRNDARERGKQKYLFSAVILLYFNYALRACQSRPREYPLTEAYTLSPRSMIAANKANDLKYLSMRTYVIDIAG